MKKQIEWTLSNGTTATYTIELQLTREINCDGDKSIVPCCEINTRMDIPGMGHLSAEILTKTGTTATGVAYVAVVGGKVALTAEVYNQIKAAKLEIEAAPEWQAKQSAIKANRAAEEADYAAKKRNGFCFKCHSYCYGDCSAN